jgi:hypothetical protein
MAQVTCVAHAVNVAHVTLNIYMACVTREVHVTQVTHVAK